MAKLSNLLLQSLVVRHTLPVCHVSQLADLIDVCCCCGRAHTMLAERSATKSANVSTRVPFTAALQSHASRAKDQRGRI